MLKREIVLIHIPFKLGYRPSGGGVRPQKMIEAFKRQGIDVEIISGGHAGRAQKFQELEEKLNREELQIKFIYSEAPANPTIMTDKGNWWKFRDFFYLIRLHKKNIPIGLFYRDIHWNINGVIRIPLYKKIIINTLHYIDLIFYNFFVDILLLPTERMAPFIPFAYFFKRAELPPGHDTPDLLPAKDLSQGLKGLFVGGVIPPVYDISKLFSGELLYDLTICCRQDEWETMKKVYNIFIPNITIVHKSGKEVSDIYLKNHIFIMLRNDHLYLKINQPLKLYEAIGFELPVLVSPGSLVADIVKELNIGWVTDKTSYEIDMKDYLDKVENIRKIKKTYTWDQRVLHLNSLFTTKGASDEH
jgi:hypothetical protein